MNPGRRIPARVVSLVALVGLLIVPTAAQAAPETNWPQGLAEAIRAALAADGLIEPQAFATLQQAKLTASDGRSYDNFGLYVAVSGNTALVGAPQANVGGYVYVGAAYVFVRSGTTWSQQAKLTASDGATGDVFGHGVALDGDTALIGAPGADIGLLSNAGAAYVFVRSGTTWSQQAKLTASDAAPGDWFGYSVALDGNTALIGADTASLPGKTSAGAAYIFSRSGTTWTQQAKLTASDAAAWDHFGYAVALDNYTAVIGAYQGDKGETADTGAAYVFVPGATTWIQQAKLTASDAAAYDWFGASVAVSGDTALVGAPFADAGGKSTAGAAYVFTRSGTTWSEQAKLTASDASVDDQFGGAVAISTATALVGARAADVGGQVDFGVAYVFTRSDSTWSEETRFTASDTTASDFFGIAVALDGTTALVGASAADVGGQPDTGAAYAFVLLPERLLNGSMEDDTDADKVPDFWKIKSPSGKSKRKCDNPTEGKYYAHLGACAVVLRSTGAKEVLQQTYTPAGGGLAGDAYTLSLWTSGKSIPASATARAVVQFAYADGTKGKFTLSLPVGTYAYQQLSFGVTAAKAYTSVKVKIEYAASGGKLYVDDVSLAQTN